MNGLFRRVPLIAALFAVLFCLPCAGVFAAENFGAEVPRVEDGGKPYLTVFGDVPFNVAELRGMHPNAHFRHVKTTNDPIAARYAATVGAWPAVVYQEPDGTVIFKATGADVPKTAQEVALVGGRCRPLFRPTPEPTPAPVAPVAPPVYEPTPAMIPDTTPISEPEAPTWIYAAVFGVALVGAAALAWIREIRGE